MPATYSFFSHFVLSRPLSRVILSRHPPSRSSQLETLLATKADISDMERRALKTEVDASLRTQMSDVYTLLRQKTEDAEFKVGTCCGGLEA